MSLFKNNKQIILAIAITLAVIFSRTVFAAWSGTFYDPGATLNPECLPTDPDCDVLAPLTSVNISDEAYDDSTWDGVTDIAPSKNAIRDKIQSLVVAGGTYVPYSGGTTDVNLGLHNLTVDTNTLFVNATNHRVGLGTAAPEAKLSIVDYTNSNSKILLGSKGFAGTDPSVAIRLVRWSGTGNNRFSTQIVQNSGYLSIEPSGDTTEGGFFSALSVHASGNVGIGTTSPGEKLEVNGNIKLAASSLLTSGSSSYAGTIKLYDASTADMVFNHKHPSAGTIQFQQGDVTKMVLDRNGNVGIGTTAPTEKLSVVGNAQIAADLGSELVTNGTFNSNITGWTTSGTMVATWQSGTMHLTQPGTGYNSAYSTVALTPGDVYYYSFDVTLNSGGNIIFQQGPNATIEWLTDSKSVSGYFVASSDSANTIRFKANNAALDWNLDNITIRHVNTGGSMKARQLLVEQNIGIGTTTPTAPLTIYGNYFYGNTALQVIDTWDKEWPNTNAFFAPNTPEMSHGAGMRFGVADSSNMMAHIDYFRNSTTPLMTFGFHSNNDLMVLSSSGSLGIGTTSPLKKLQVNDTLHWLQIGDNQSNSNAIGLFTDNGAITLPSAVNIATQSTSISSSADMIAHYGYSGHKWNVYNGTSIIEAMRITSTGNVGIGTTSPGYALHVYKTGATSQLFINNPTGITGDTSGILFGTSPSETYAKAGIFFERLTGSAEGTLHFATGNSGGAQVVTKANARMSIDSAGNVGIGTTSPGAKLDVNGSVKLQSSNNNTYDNGEKFYVHYDALNNTGSTIEISSDVVDTFTPGSLYFGTQIVGRVQSTGSLGSTGSMVSLFNAAEYSGNTSLNNLYGIWSRVVVNSSFDVTNGISLYAGPPDKWSTGNFLNTYGLYVASTTLGTQNNYGVYQPGTSQKNYFAANVGIGTIAPNNILSVTPSQYSTGTASQSITTVTGVGTTWTSAMVGSQFVFANGVSAGTITAFNSSTNLTVSTSQTVSSQAYKISYTGLQVGSTGKVGIGTTAPEFELDVRGGVGSTRNEDNAWAYALWLRKSRGSVSSPTIVQSGDETGVIDFRGYDGNSWERTASIYSYVEGTPGNDDMPGNLIFNTTPDGSRFALERMRITNSGNVGIGTTAPGTRLSLGASSPNVANSKVSVYDNGTITYGIGLAQYTNYGLGLYSADTITGVPKVFIESTGNVGIGTTAPAYPFEVVGNMKGSGYALLGSNVYGNGDSIFYRSNVNRDNISVGTLTAGGAYPIIIGSGDGSSYTGGYLSFKTDGSDRMRIDSSGNIGIGTTSPGQKLDVAGTIRQSGCTTAGGLSANASGDIICDPSSEHFKNNINSLESGLSNLLSLRPVSYVFKTGMNMGDRIHYGFISEEVASVTPEFATYDSFGHPYGLDTNAILATTVKAIQELDLKINATAGIDTSDSSTETFVTTFFENVYTKMITWMGDTANGIGDFFANRVHTKELCIKDDTGETCITRGQLEALISGSNSGGNSDNGESSTSGDTTGDTTTDGTTDTTGDNTDTTTDTTGDDTTGDTTNDTTTDTTTTTDSTSDTSTDTTTTSENTSGASAPEPSAPTE